jgi:hypothetical protein
MKFGVPVEPAMPHRPGLGKSLSECRTLHEVAEYTRLAERAESQGITQGLDTRCPHCRRKFAVSLIDGLINGADSSRRSRVRAGTTGRMPPSRLRSAVLTDAEEGLAL